MRCEYYSILEEIDFLIYKAKQEGLKLKFIELSASEYDKYIIETDKQGLGSYHKVDRGPYIGDETTYIPPMYYKNIEIKRKKK